MKGGGKKMEIDELNLSDKEKQILAELETPKTIAQVSALGDWGYSTGFTKLKVWEAKGWVIGQQVGRLKKYYINQDVLQL
jgi:hypothetical protein